MKDFFSFLRRSDGGSPPRSAIIHDRDRISPNLRWLVALSIGVSLVFVAIFFWSDKGLAELRRLDRRAEAIGQDTAMLSAENERLRAEIAKAPKDRLRFERLAREELGLVKPGEVVLVLPPRSSRPRADRNDPPRTWEIREREEIAKASNPPK